jgi:ketosteroid isomerase-like protein
MKNFPDHFEVKLIIYISMQQNTFIIAEFTSDGHAVSTGKPYIQKYISVVTTDDEGKIIRYVDFGILWLRWLLMLL